MAVTDNNKRSMRDLSGSLDDYTKWISNFTTRALALTTVKTGIIAGVAEVPPAPATGEALLSQIAAAWVLIRNAATNESTKNHGTIAAQKVARTKRYVSTGGVVYLSITALMREFVKTCQASFVAGTLVEQDMVDMGINDHTNRRSVALVPLQGPILEIKEQGNKVVQIAYKNANTGEDSKKKPVGCKGVIINWVCANGLSGSFFLTKCPYPLDFSKFDVGNRLVTFWGNWHMGSYARTIRVSPDGPRITVPVIAQA